jgi:hypothetical protein
MFEHFFTKNTQSDNGQTLMIPEPTGNTIIFFHHEADRDLWNDLAPHIHTLVLRLPNLFKWKYYYYRSRTISSESKHEEFVSDLEHALLFLPCTSVSFLNTFWQDTSSDARMPPLLAQTYVQPIPLRAAHGVWQSLLPKPLAAYPSGHARDEACVQVVATLEQKLLSYQGIRSNADVEAPLALLAETTNKLMLPATGSRK